MNLRSWIWVVLLVGSALFVACGEPDSKPAAQEEPLCEGESDATLCEGLGAACGELETTDGCGEARVVSCGGCEDGLVCDSNFECVWPALQPHELCHYRGRSLGPCDEGLSCVQTPLGEEGVCVRQCDQDEQCLDGQVCHRIFGPAGGVCGDPGQAGDECVHWWEGPQNCASSGSLLICLEGTCEIACDYWASPGVLYECPQGMICDYARIENPEYPGYRVSTCIDRPIVDPCAEVPEGGRCVSYRSYDICSEEGDVAEIECAPSERCEQGPEGARCVELETPCLRDHSYCSTETTLRSCGRARTWEEEVCGLGCIDTPSGAACKREGETTIFEGTLLYERRDPNDALTDWSEPKEAPAAGLLALSYQGEVVVDRSEVERDGAFALRIPVDPNPETDRIVFLATGDTIARPGSTYAVMDPGLEPGLYRQRAQTSWDVETWLWSIELPAASDQTFVIREADGSGAIQLFQAVQKGMRRNAAEYGPSTRSVVLWWAPGVVWECGACFVSTAAFGMNSQIVIGGSSNLEQASDGVSLHELGHFTMWAHGIPPGEGGTHCVFVPALPGLAWSEGFANWYSSEVRRSDLQYQKRRGTFSYFTLDPSFPYSGQIQSPRPTAGLLQRLDEVWVASSLRQLGAAAGSSRPLWEALASERMTVAPFARGYFRHRTSGVDAHCHPIDPVPTTRSVPVFPDFLDALVCGGMSPELVDQVVLPSYPYPSHSPLCLDGG